METPRTNFMVWPNDGVEELLNDDSGDTIVGTIPGIYQQLRDAGLPLSGSSAGAFADIIDFSVDADGRVVAYTENPAGEHPFPLATVQPLLDAWKAMA